MVTINYVDGFYTKVPNLTLSDIEVMIEKRDWFIVTDEQNKPHIVITKNITHIKEN